MASSELLIFVLLLLGPSSVLSQTFDPLSIHQPSITLLAEDDGDVRLTSGENANVHVLPGENGTVYLDGVDLLELVEIIRSEPPIWVNTVTVSKTSIHGYLGTFTAGTTVTIPLIAMDPEGTPITYSRAAGDFPPGLSISPTTGEVTGIVPDADTTYVVTVRATDAHGKFADQTFRIVTRGYDSCSSNPCSNEGQCTDYKGTFSCACVSPYGGSTCNLNCAGNNLGIRERLKYVSDAQMTGFNMYRSNVASEGRYGGSSAWYGIDSTSYLQIDFGNTTDIYRVYIQTLDIHYYITSFYMQYSLNGNDFYNYANSNGARETFSFAYTTNTIVTLPTILTARYVRVFPLVWHRSYHPAMRIEMYGCYSYK